MLTRIEILRMQKADWDQRDLCPLCKGSGEDEESETGCVNCDGVGVVPVCSWEEYHKAEAKELANLEYALERNSLE